MEQDDFMVAEDRLEKTLMKADYVSLLRIPPPKCEGDTVTDISQWDLSDVVWFGKLKFTETEFIMNMDPHNLEERQIIQGNVSLINYDSEDIFGNIPYRVDGNNVKVVTALKTHDDFVNDLEQGVQSLKLDQDSPSEVKTEEFLPENDIKKISEPDTEESDLEFGDFVTSET
ncbi:unnamed protein product [Wickerhamomyces anomalus]